jgi:hypothetical protein
VAGEVIVLTKGVRNGCIGSRFFAALPSADRCQGICGKVQECRTQQRSDKLP